MQVTTMKKKLRELVKAANATKKPRLAELKGKAIELQYEVGDFPELAQELGLSLKARSYAAFSDHMSNGLGIIAAATATPKAAKVKPASQPVTPDKHRQECLRRLTNAHLLKQEVEQRMKTVGVKDCILINKETGQALTLQGASDLVQWVRPLQALIFKSPLHLRAHMQRSKYKYPPEVMEIPYYLALVEMQKALDENIARYSSAANIR